MTLIKELYNYREMLFSLVRKNLRGRYKGSVLGFLWTFLIPLLQLGVYTLVFSVIMKSGYDKYYLFLFTALVPWVFFSGSVASGTGCIWDQRNMVNKIYFPREILPIAHVTYLLVNMLLSLLIVFAVLILSGHGINLVAILYLPLVIFIEYLLALGITMLMSALDVYFRDLQYIMEILTMAWQFLTPVMYGLDVVPEELRTVFRFNPMTSVIECFRDIMYYQRIPDISTLGLAAFMGVFFMMVGVLAFGRLKRGFSEGM